MQITDDRLATYICKKGERKTQDCVCDSCRARKRLFTHNIGIVEQEKRRMALTQGLINSLHEWAPKDKD